MRLVFLHALPFDGRMWREHMDLLPGATVAPDLYRFGASLTSWAEGVLALVGAGPLIVVGCSVGGACALELARLAPGSVRGLVLVSTKASVQPEPASRDEAVRLLHREGMSGAWRRTWAPLWSPNAPPTAVEEARTNALAQDVHDVVRGVQAFHDRHDLTEVASSFAALLVVISGALDRTPSARAQAQLAEGRNRRHHIVDGCGHYVSLERPALFRELLRAAIADIASA